MRTRSLGIACPLLLIVCGVHPALANEYLHSRLKSGEMKVRTVIVLPPKVEITKVGVKGVESMLEEQEAFKAQVEAAVTRALADRGIRIGECPFTDAKLQEDPDLKYKLADFQARHDRLMQNIVQKPKDIQKGRFSMGDEITDLVLPGDVDAVVFVRAFASQKTFGARFLGNLANPYAHSPKRLTIVRMTLVHPGTGDVLGLLEATGDAKFEKPVARAVNKLPK